MQCVIFASSFVILSIFNAGLMRSTEDRIGFRERGG
jgi:hypothetical protein